MVVVDKKKYRRMKRIVITSCVIGGLSLIGMLYYALAGIVHIGIVG